jgi:hypothetical protein
VPQRRSTKHSHGSSIAPIKQALRWTSSSLTQDESSASTRRSASLFWHRNPASLAFCPLLPQVLLFAGEWWGENPHYCSMDEFLRHRIAYEKRRALELHDRFSHESMKKMARHLATEAEVLSQNRDCSPLAIETLLTPVLIWKEQSRS